ncbi:platelet glycoprotein IX [Chanos chanos]|uniref:Platelet glycoprotein IX n=1 Tax=Chanos chanos TaxID=29144 RepID=A0A6J2V0S3_CHACN|nr:platelet glycoprotein IX-like [Chanos chanos]
MFKSEGDSICADFSLRGSVILLLLGLCNAQASCEFGKCSSSPSAGVKVNCSSQGLTHMPHFPSGTTEIYLQENELATVPPGYFDRLQNLQLVNLSGNPFHCGCAIQYLRNWLKEHSAIATTITCASPVTLANKKITDLTDADLSSCIPKPCSGTLFNTFMIFALCVLIILLVWSLRLAKTSTFILGIYERHSGFEAESLRSLKPKHKKRLQNILEDENIFTSPNEEPEQPLLNMEILPQILDVLHKKHNIKIKAV